MNMSGSKYYNSSNKDGGLFAKRRKQKIIVHDRTESEEREEKLNMFNKKIKEKEE